MIPSHDTTSPLREMERLLRVCRRRVWLSVVVQGLRRGLDRTLVGLTILSGGYLLATVAVLLSGRALPISRYGMALLAIAVVSVIVIVSLVRAVIHLPTFLSAAERLDLATRSHNRVATAFWLLKAGDRSAFARAAVDDGMFHLGRIKNELPHAGSPGWSWRKKAAPAALIIALTALSVLVGVPRRAEAGKTVRLPAGVNCSASAFEEKASKPTSQPTNPRSSALRIPASVPSHAGEPAKAGDRAENRSEPSTASHAGGATQTGVRWSQPASGSQGEAADSASGSASERPSSERAGAGKRSSEARAMNPKTPTEETGASSVTRGSTGGGAMLAVRNSWSQTDRNISGDNDPEDTGQEPEDQRESNTQRGGIQPSLKDRNEAPSRELSIGEGQGPPGAGRGGPTPPKKSRGTASLILGVPIPDFIKGRLAPGATKVVHERVKPTVLSGEPSGASEVVARSLPESPSADAHSPLPFARLVRAYLIALHAGDAPTIPESPLAVE